MNTQKVLITLLLSSVLFGCTSPTAAPIIQAVPEETNTMTLPLPTVMAISSATKAPDFPEGCIKLTATTFNPAVLNGLLVVEDNDVNNYFLNPKTSQILGIGEELQSPSFLTFPNIVSPNRKFMEANDLDKKNSIIRTVDKIIKTYVPEDDWNRGRWLDNEHIFYQNWLVPHGNTIVIYNPFTGEQKNMQLNLPDPYIVIDGGGKAAWVRADIDPSLKRVLYNDNKGRLVVWDLDARKEIASVPPPTDLGIGTWSPDGKEYVTPWPAQTSDVPVASELMTIDMDGTVTKLTSFNQKYPFASVDFLPTWSPDGRRIGFWLRVDPNLKDQWLAITDTITHEAQIYCLTPNVSGHGIVWSPDGQQVIVNTVLASGMMKPTLVDLAHRTRATLDTKGLWVDDWMAP